MNPQHSSPARAVSRCSEALQVNVCTKYKLMHHQAFIKISTMRYILPGGKQPSYCVPLYEIGGRTKNPESVSRPPNEHRCSVTARSLARCSSAPQRQFSPIDKHIKFNRMNGSPGDPPANRMHISNQKESLLLITVSRVIQPARRPVGRQQHKEIQ